MNNVQAERIKRGMSIAQFSIKVGIAETTLRKIEDPHDTGRVHIDTAKQIAKHLDVTVRSLFPDGGELTTQGGRPGRPNLSEPKTYPVCGNCHMEIPPRFNECPECN